VIESLISIVTKIVKHCSLSPTSKIVVNGDALYFCRNQDHF